eukprot:gene13556-20877_t
MIQPTLKCDQEPDWGMQREFWNNYAAMYDDSYYGYWSSRAHDHFLLDDKLNVKGKRVLDAGCGTGALAVELAARGASVTAVDWSQGMIEAATERVMERELDEQQHVAGYKLDINFLEQDIASVDLPEDSFDIIICHDVLPYVADVPTTLANLRKFLKPHGTCTAAYTCMQQSAGLELMTVFAKGTEEYELEAGGGVGGMQQVNPIHKYGRRSLLEDAMKDAEFAYVVAQKKPFETSFSDLNLYKLAEASYGFSTSFYNNEPTGHEPGPNKTMARVVIVLRKRHDKN